MTFDPGRDMAIPHMFDSNTPFVIVTAGAELSFLGKSDVGRGCEEEKESLVQAIAPHLSRVMQQGTAKHVGAPEAQGGSEDDPSVSIVAQAEREDFQEFSPTNTQSLYSRSLPLKKRRSLSRETGFSSCSEDEDEEVRVQLLHYHLQRKQRRKSWRQLQEDGDQPPVIRGLWVQEIDWLKSASSAHVIPPPPQFKDSSCAEDASGPEDQVQDAAGLDSDCSLELDSVCTQEESDSDSSRAADDDDYAGTSNLTFDLMQVSGFNSHAGWDSDSTGCVRSPLGPRCVLGFGDLSDAETVLKELRGRVTHVPKLYAASFLKDAIRRTLSEWTSSSGPNEGLIFHQQLEPSSSSQYREEEEYSVLHHIHNGSYGDVFCVRDKRTGFRCAAKKIPLSGFSSEEVQTWSALDSPRVVELFGAVREGPSVVLFMDLKPACLAQLLRRMNSLPEDLALHYLHQTLGALEHLHHRRVLHLDVKVDNVLLSADCRDSFLCDFGLSQTLDASGRSSEAFRGAPFPGTETHMAPEVARGDGLCPKADVWSSCCMLLHMLNGCPPWIRCFSHPLCLQIVNEPPPLWEVPSHCNHFTAKVFRAGLQKDPDRRASAKELRRKTTKALRAVGGLSSWSVKEASEKLFHGEDQDEDSSSSSSSSSSIPPPEARAEAAAPAMFWVSPWRTTAVEEDSDESEAETDSVVRDWDSDPKPLQVNSDWDSWSGSEVDIYMGEEEYREGKWLKTDGDYEGDWEEEGDEEEEEEEDWDSSGSTEHLRALRDLFPLLQRGQPTDVASWGSEPELKYLRDDLALGTAVQTPSPEPRDDPPSCFSCSDTSQVDASDKDSDRSSDDLSSGVFSSCNSQTDGQLTEWAVSANQPSSYCFEGVDIWIENVQGECLRIRERRQVKVGHVAIGISDQVCGSPFTLETLDRKTLPFEQEVRESSLWLRCVPAPDRCQRWSWRVRDGKLELRE